MVKSSKILRVIVSVCLLATLLVSMTGCQTFVKEVEIYSYDRFDAFSYLSIDADTADIEFIPTDDGTRKVECYQDQNSTHFVGNVGTTLKITQSETTKVKAMFFFDFYPLKIKVYLPRGEYGGMSVSTDTGDIEIPEGFTFGGTTLSTDTGDIEVDGAKFSYLTVSTDTGDVSLENVTVDENLSIKTQTGDIELESCSARELTANSDTGSIELDKFSCENLDLTANTGKITLKDTIASGKFQILSVTGEVNFKKCDAAEIYVNTDTGSVTGSFLTDKIIFATTETGKVDVPHLTIGGKCEITTCTGDIKITIVK